MWTAEGQNGRHRWVSLDLFGRFSLPPKSLEVPPNNGVFSHDPAKSFRVAITYWCLRDDPPDRSPNEAPEGQPPWIVEEHDEFSPRENDGSPCRVRTIKDPPLLSGDVSGDLVLVVDGAALPLRKPAQVVIR
jgi:hypothetical protein